MGDVTQPDKEDVTDKMDMNTGGGQISCMKSVLIGTLMLQHHWPYSASTTQNHNTCVPSVDALWGPKTWLSGGPHSYW